MRKINRPPPLRAQRWLKNAVRALPRCKAPVGLGANRVTTGNESKITGILKIVPIRVESRSMKHLLLIIGLISTTWLPVSFAAETQPKAPAPTAPATSTASPRVQVVTSLGSFTLELNAERAPLTVAHFLKYVDQGHYSGTIFHRVIANFVIQGGGFDSSSKPVPAPAKG